MTGPFPTSSSRSVSEFSPAPAAGLAAALDGAIAQLRTGDFQQRWDAAKTLPGFGTSAIAPLLVLLEEDSDWELLWFVARILGSLNDPTAIAALAQLLKTTDNSEVAGMAATALANSGEAAIAPLSELLTNSATRILAVQALAQIRHPDVVPPLLTMATDPAVEIRAAALDALSHFYSPAISAVLLAALTDPVAAVRQAAVVGLGLQAAQQDRQALAQQLKPLLWDLNLEVCRQAAIALARVGTEAAIEALFAVLRSPHTPPPLQIEAVRALAWVGTPFALDQLQQFLALAATGADAAASAVAQEVISVLGRAESAGAKSKATEILLHLLASDQPIAQTTRGRQTIALSLGQLGQLQALEAVIQLLADADPSVQFHAIAALKQLAPEAAYERLQQLATDAATNAALRTGAAVALREWY